MKRSSVEPDLLVARMKTGPAQAPCWSLHIQYEASVAHPYAVRSLKFGMAGR